VAWLTEGQRLAREEEIPEDPVRKEGGALNLSSESKLPFAFIYPPKP
jgi:hypothetical protein